MNVKIILVLAMIMYAVGNLSKCIDDPVGGNNTTLHNNLSTRVNNASTTTTKSPKIVTTKSSLAPPVTLSPVSNCGSRL